MSEGATVNDYSKAEIDEVVRFCAELNKLVHVPSTLRILCTSPFTLNFSVLVHENFSFGLYGSVYVGFLITFMSYTTV